MNKNTIWGVVCGVMTGICWALAGVFGQFLFQNKNIEATWLVSIRLLTAGILLLIYAFFTNKEELVSLIKNKRDFLQSVISGVFGTLLFQGTFYVAVQHSNAATATVLQYLAPAIIMIYVCMRSKRIPNKVEILCIILALGGIFLISTHGNINSLSMTPEGLFWGIACAFGMFTDTILPEKLNKKYSPLTVMASSFFFGGLASVFILKPYEQTVQMDVTLLIILFLSIVLGSIAAYIFYRKSVLYIGPAKASLFSTSEALAATILSVLWLKTEFLFIDFVGFAMILSMVFILTISKEK